MLLLTSLKTLLLSLMIVITKSTYFLGAFNAYYAKDCILCILCDYIHYKTEQFYKLHNFDPQQVT